MAGSTARNKKDSPAAPVGGFKPGDYVTNPLKKEWGPGRVVDLKRDVVFVYFRDRPGKEIIRMKQSGLRPGERDAELEAIPGFVETASGFAVDKKGKAFAKQVAAKGKGKKGRPVIVFDDPVDIEEIELPPDEEMEAELDEE